MRAGRTVVGALLLLIPLVWACGPKDPHEEVLSERKRWDVTPKTYVQAEDGTIRLTVSVSGPARTKIEQLTFRIEYKDGAGQVAGEQWKTVALSGVPMGAAADFTFELDTEVPYEELNLEVDRVLAPTPEQSAQIPELQL